MESRPFFYWPHNGEDVVNVKNGRTKNLKNKNYSPNRDCVVFDTVTMMYKKKLCNEPKREYTAICQGKTRRTFPLLCTSDDKFRYIVSGIRYTIQIPFVKLVKFVMSCIERQYFKTI